jgi:hypothetical protein
MLTITKCQVTSVTTNGKPVSGTAWFSDGRVYDFSNYTEVTFYGRRKRGAINESFRMSLPKRETALKNFLTNQWDGKRHIIHVKL